jgi:hypothetical protein
MSRRLTELANECGTDKGTVHGGGHGYTLIYEALFESIRQRSLNVLEVGLQSPGPLGSTFGPPRGSAFDWRQYHEHREVIDVPSLRMWSSYFPYAKIFGVDISDFSVLESDRFKFFRADCGDERQLDKVVAELSASGVAMDLIIDDASHASFDQQLTFLKLFPLLKEGGFYIIEDLQWQPKRYGRKLPKTSMLLRSFVETGQLKNTGSMLAQPWQSILSRIGSVLLFDESYLLHQRHGYNLRSGTSPEQPSYIETSLPKRLILLQHFRHVYEQMRRTVQLCLTGVAPICGDRLALAIIQKI